jgi:hypothetical protein
MFAVNALVVATPLVLVTTVVVLPPPDANAPLAPLAGAVKVTLVPPTSTGLALASSMVALKGVVNVAPTAALCAAPAEATT